MTQGADTSVPARVTPREVSGRELLCANLAPFPLFHEGKRFQQGQDDEAQ